MRDPTTAVRPPPQDERDAPRDRDLAAALDRSVAAGIIARAQADAILQAEAGRPGPSRDLRLRGLAAEALGYVGAALATVSVILVAQRYWDDLRPWSRVTLLALVAVALTAAGAAVHAPEHSGPLHRLKSLLWFAASAAVAGGVGVAAADLVDLGPEATALTVGGATAVFSLVLWSWRRTSLQQVAFAASTVGAVMGGLALGDVDLERFAGVVLWVLGVAWLLLAYADVPRPTGTAFVLGGSTAVLGPFVATSDDEMRWVLVLGLVTAVGLVGVSVLVHRTALLAIGTLGLFVHVPRIVFVFFGEALGPPVALFVTGIVLIGVALGLTRLRVRTRSGGDRP